MYEQFVDNVRQNDIVNNFNAVLEKYNETSQYKVQQRVKNGKELVQSAKFVLFIDDESIQHIKSRHQNTNSPGSLIKPNLNIREIAKLLLNKEPKSEGDKLKWEGVDTGSEVGTMGLAHTSPEELKSDKYRQFKMVTGESVVTIGQGERTPTNEITMITTDVGILPDGRKALTLITMFPGGMLIDGVVVPFDRNLLATNGLYFVVPNIDEVDKSIVEPIKKEN